MYNILAASFLAVHSCVALKERFCIARAQGDRRAQAPRSFNRDAVKNIGSSIVNARTRKNCRPNLATTLIDHK